MGPRLRGDDVAGSAAPPDRSSDLAAGGRQRQVPGPGLRRDDVWGQLAFIKSGVIPGRVGCGNIALPRCTRGCSAGYLPQTTDRGPLSDRPARLAARPAERRGGVRKRRAWAFRAREKDRRSIGLRTPGSPYPKTPSESRCGAIRRSTSPTDAGIAGAPEEKRGLAPEIRRPETRSRSPASKTNRKAC